MILGIDIYYISCSNYTFLDMPLLKYMENRYIICHRKGLGSEHNDFNLCNSIFIACNCFNFA